jgi:hypothetical protein
MTIYPIADMRLLDAICRTDVVSFIRRCFHLLAPGTTFHMTWHIEAMAHAFEQVRLGKIKRLIINVPPRSLKSIVGSVAFPAFVLGHDPRKHLVVVSYGSDLAVKHANDFRAVMNSQWYQGLFRLARVSAIKNTELEFITSQNGGRLATSIDATLTGRGGDIVIIDDPLKPVDALSDSKRERVKNWYKNTLVSRLDDKQNGAIIVVMQRLHVDDLVGMLLRDSPDEWSVLTLPAIAEQEEIIKISANRCHIRQIGEVLHPEREPKSILESMRAQFGSRHLCGAVSARADPSGRRDDSTALGPSL